MNSASHSTASQTIAAMDSISLTEMDSVSLMNRVDTKYALAETDLEELLRSIKADYRVLTIEQTRHSPYATLYFDSPDHDCFLQHHNGKLNRQKIRMREYQSTGLCFLEAKHKNNKGRTQKRRISIPSIEETFSEEATQFLLSLAAPQFELTPQMWTRFSRITLVDRDCLERVTLDCDLEFQAGDQKKSLPGVVIAEIKQARDNRHSKVREQLRRQEIRPLRVSKYCLGTMLLKPELKSNLFKSKLRAIRSIA